MFSLSSKDVKEILQMDETEHDNYINIMIPIVISIVENYCNDVFAVRNVDGTLFKDQEGYLIFEAGIILAIAKIIEFYMLESGISQNTVSRVTYTFSTELPKSIKDILNQYRKVRFI